MPILKIRTQAEKINKLISNEYDINLVTCWACWTILSHRKDYRWDLSCLHCMHEWDQYEFPDLFY